MFAYKEIERRLRSLCDRSAIDVQFKEESFRFTRRNSPYLSRQGCDIAAGHGFDRTIIFGSIQEDGADVLFIHAEKDIMRGTIVSRQVPTHFLPALSFPASYPAWAKTGLIWASYPDTFSGFAHDGKPLFNGNPYVQLYGQEILTRRDYEPYILYKGRDYYEGDIIDDEDLNVGVNSDKVQIDSFHLGLSILGVSADDNDNRWEVIKITP